MAGLSRLVRSALRRRARRLPPGTHSGGDRPDRGRLLWRGDPAPLAAPAGGGGASQVAVDRLRATGLRTAGPSGRSRLRRYRLTLKSIYASIAWATACAAAPAALWPRLASAMRMRA